jgi:serine/threonine protein kinase
MFLANRSVVDGKYTIVRELGLGGMGAVALVTDAAGQFLALKYCTADDSESIRRFAREVRIMSTISHPNVMPVLDSSVDHRPPYFVMPVARASLETQIRALAPDEAAALNVFRDICAGVQAIHRSNATHRDLKPSNILQLDDGTLVVSDLGLAKLNQRDSTILTQASVIMGTEVYCAPEQWMLGGSRDADARTDVYQLGKVLQQLLTGEMPVYLDRRRIPAALCVIIAKATAERPEDRYQSVEALLEAVAAYEPSPKTT